MKASLVIAQKWAEQKNDILLVTPASPGQAWNQELPTKFRAASRSLSTARLPREQPPDWALNNPFDHPRRHIVYCVS